MVIAKTSAALPRDAVSAIKGRAKRTDNAATVLLQTRVIPEVRDAVHSAAERSGVSVALYLEALVLRYIEAEGELPSLAVLDRIRGATVDESNVQVGTGSRPNCDT